jgi:zinc protease
MTVSAATSIPRWTVGVRREVLPNGLTLLVQRDSSAPVAAVVTHVRAGFFDEPDRWVGISHVLEHMFFKGTPTHGPGQIAKATKALGGYLNASTTYDQTTYFAVFPARGLRPALAIQADALQHALLDAGELSRELQVIIQEAKRKLDSPEAVVQETLHEVMFDRHRMRRWRIGYERDLARFTREDVSGYYRSRYVPERTIVAIVGDVEEELALGAAREAYGAWSAGPPAVDRSPEEPPRREVRARTLRGDVTVAELVCGWRGVAPLDPDAIALDVAAAILGTGRGSWLYRALRETGRALSVSAGHYSPTELGVFSVGAECDPDCLDQVVAEIAACTRRLALVGPTSDDLDRARTLLLTGWSRRLEETEGRALALAAGEALESYQLVDRDFQLLAEVTEADIRRVSARYLDPGAVAACAYLPGDRGAEITPASLSLAFSVTPPALASAPLLAPPSPPAPRPMPGRDEAEVRHTALPAFDLLVRRKPGSPTVSLGVYFPRLQVDPLGRAGLGALTVRSAIRGAGEFDAPGLAFAFERLGGTLASSVALDWLGFRVTVLESRLAEAAALLDLVLTEPAFAPAHVAAERDILVSETRQVADDMYRYPFQLAFAAAYGDREYGIPASGLPETLVTITAEEVRRWHRAAVLEPRGVVVAVGDLDPDAASAVLAGVFGTAPRRPMPPPWSPVAWAAVPAGQPRVVPRAKAQSAFALVFPGPSRRAGSRYAAEVWSAVASGLGGRLFEALRERRSLAYTVMASSWQRARGGALLAYIATSPEREEEARQAMLKELARFAEEPVTPEELARASTYLAGQVAVNRQTGGAIASEIVEAWLAGEGLAELPDPGARYMAVTVEEVREVVREALRGPRAEGVVRGSGGGR